MNQYLIKYMVGLGEGIEKEVKDVEIATDTNSAPRRSHFMVKTESKINNYKLMCIILRAC